MAPRLAAAARAAWAMADPADMLVLKLGADFPAGGRFSLATCPWFGGAVGLCEDGCACGWVWGGAFCATAGAGGVGCAAGGAALPGVPGRALSRIFFNSLGSSWGFFEVAMRSWSEMILVSGRLVSFCASG